MRITFRDDIQTGTLLDFLLGPRLWVPGGAYPDYLDWLARIEPELQRGDKRHLGCVWNGELAGVVVWQRHKQQPAWLEIKNLTVRPENSGRLVGSFLLRQAEVAGTQTFGSVAAVCDAKQSARGVLSFLARQQYRAQAVQDLYGIGSGADVVMSKPLPADRETAASPHRIDP